MRFILPAAAWLCCTLSAMSQNQFLVTVFEKSSNEPLPNATLQLSSRVGITGADGTYVFDDVPKGLYTLKISYVGYRSVEQTVKIPDTDRVDVALQEETYLTDEVVVSATRASETTPMTYTSVDRENIEQLNFGQDLPFILNFTPSLVTTSDAGAGVGYTGLRIRGSDATRINVTINGIPLNDSESQGVFWVNTPDLASSTDNIQIQRGVGTSTNGAAAFGASVNLQTNTRREKPYANIVNSFGSFNTRRHTLAFGTGLFKKYWTLDGRVSKIESDGYIDRASSDLKSYYFAGGFYKGKTMIKGILFGGAERTYQSWYGVPQAVVENDSLGREIVIANANSNKPLTDLQEENIRTSDRTFNWYLYDNEVDDYKQDHYQLHLSHELSPGLVANLSAHYTYGRGFFEQYRYNDKFKDYGSDDIIMSEDTIRSSDIVRRRWLDNDFYGFTYALNYKNNNLDATWGGAANRYDGDHFGELIWAQFANNIQHEDRYYFSVGEKEDINSFVKATYNFTSRLSVYADMQYRYIGYRTAGTDNDQVQIDVDESFHFFNPKAGAFYQLNENNSVYASFAVANREPVRNDFIDSPVTPKSERLNNLELGYKYRNNNIQAGINGYYMDYKDQLILTGELNDVGSSVRTNVEKSYRAGLELVGGIRFNRFVNWQANVTLSQNKIEQYTERLNDYLDYSIASTDYSDTDIAYSPNIIAGSQLTFTPFDNAEVAILSKYVGDQFLDNTSNEARKLDAYLVNDIRLSYTLLSQRFKALKFSLLISNVLDEEYASNGYSFGYFYGRDFEARENYVYPQATRHFLATVSFGI